MSDISILLAQFDAGPGLLADAIAGLSVDQLNATPVPERWTVHQVVCHIADFEIVSADRVRRVLAEENPTLADGDPDLFVTGLKYGQRDTESELGQIKAIRRSLSQILHACDIEDFQRTAVHSADGPLTLETLVERITNHISHHVRFIEEKRQAMDVLQDS